MANIPVEMAVQSTLCKIGQGRTDAEATVRNSGKGTSSGGGGRSTRKTQGNRPVRVSLTIAVASSHRG